MTRIGRGEAAGEHLLLDRGRKCREIEGDVPDCEPRTVAAVADRTHHGGRALTLVIERTIDPTTWLIVTGWNATEVERRLLGGQ